jgi:hypothetical protein
VGSIVTALSIGLGAWTFEAARWSWLASPVNPVVLFFWGMSFSVAAALVLTIIRRTKRPHASFHVTSVFALVQLILLLPMFCLIFPPL